MRSTAVLAFAVAAAGCSPAEIPNDPGVVCTAIAVSSLNVTVRDAASGLAVCDAGVFALANDGVPPTMIPLRQTGACTYAGAEERAGEFDVFVSRTGYASRRVAGIVVGRDECHVIPVQLTVDVQSCPPGCDPEPF